MNVTVYTVKDGLDRHEFADYGFAREMLSYLGWVETGRSVPHGSPYPSQVTFFNKEVGGDGRLFPDPEGGIGWEFYAREGWVGRVLSKWFKAGKLLSPTEEAKVRPMVPPGSVLDLFGE